MRSGAFKWILKRGNKVNQDQLEAQVDNKNHKYAREIWNAALDKAARECDKVQECKAAARIRELKKK